MIPAETIATIVHSLRHGGDRNQRDLRGIASELEAAFTAAVAAEREACAKIAEKRSSGLTIVEIRASETTARSIAAAIRARNGAGSK